VLSSDHRPVLGAFKLTATLANPLKAVGASTCAFWQQLVLYHITLIKNSLLPGNNVTGLVLRGPLFDSSVALPLTRFGSIWRARAAEVLGPWFLPPGGVSQERVYVSILTETDVPIEAVLTLPRTEEPASFCVPVTCRGLLWGWFYGHSHVLRHADIPSL
jgi:hypothetical protein